MSAHLCVRSHFSLLNGLMNVEDVVLTAKQNGFSHLALTEYNVMYSTLEFYNMCLKYDVKPIYGMEAQFDGYTSILLAKDSKGVQALYRIAYILSNQDFIELSDIEADRDHLVLILLSENGPFEAALTKGENILVSDMLDEFKETFKYLYVGISHQESKFFQKYNTTLVELAQGSGVKAVALPKVYYKNEHDAEAFKALRALKNDKQLNDPTLTSEPGRYFLNKKTMESLYSQDLLLVIDEVLALCNVNLGELTTKLPHYHTGHDVDNAQYLKVLSKVGLKRRLNNVMNDVYLKRLEYELKVINDLEFTDYFLIVYDIVLFAKNEGILVGPGRGSAAGSLVAYSLGITDVDPLVYGLMFERFLNPERNTKPDIDIDIPGDRRDEVIDYINRKYGKDHVAHIISFGTFKAKGSFSASAKLLDIPVKKAASITKKIYEDSLIEAYNKNKSFAKLINTDTSLQACFDLALKIEGKPTHTSMHAAGLVLSKRPIIEVAPLKVLDENRNILQYDMTYIEDIGLVKIDLLALTSLTTIQAITNAIKEQNPDFMIQAIALDDQKTFDLLGKGSTTGIFQLESAGMRDLVINMQPTSFMDIVATIALYRPGAMGNKQLYLDNRANPENVKYIHKDLEKITKDTYGILVYQEQTMEVARIFAGFSLAKADILRRAMSKKDASMLKGLESDFITGSVNRGYSESLAKEVFDLIYKFADYGFNKSHSVAYALITYQLAYLKANYPQYFYTSLLTSVINDTEKTKSYFFECKKHDITLLPPDLNVSSTVYSSESGSVRLPLTIIKGFAIKSVSNLIAEREQFGPYPSFIDSVVRLLAIGINSAQLSALISSGAMDSFNQTRETMHASIERIIEYAELVTTKDTFGMSVMDYSIVSRPELVFVKRNDRLRLEKEHEVLGLYLGDHPIMILRTKHQTTALKDLKVQTEAYRIIATISSMRKIRDKNGNEMAFLVVEDDTGSIDAVLFSSIYRNVKDLLKVGDQVLLLVQYKQMDSKIIQKIHRLDKE